jgi:hypothetical protein
MQRLEDPSAVADGASMTPVDAPEAGALDNASGDADAADADAAALAAADNANVDASAANDTDVAAAAARAWAVEVQNGDCAAAGCAFALHRVRARRGVGVLRCGCTPTTP